MVEFAKGGLCMAAIKELHGFAISAAFEWRSLDMSLFKRASTYGMMFTFLLAAGLALIGLAQSRPVVLQHRPVDASCADMEAALRTPESRMWNRTKDRTEP
jgi:hypothetical protein